MLLYERTCYKLGLRGFVPADMWSGRFEPVYITDKAFEIYDYLLDNPGSTNEEVSNALGFNYQIVRNHLSLLTRREIVRGFDDNQARKRGPIKLKYRVVRKINRRRED